MTASTAPRPQRDWRVRALAVAVVVLALALAAVVVRSVRTQDEHEARLALAQVSATTLSVRCDGRTAPYTPTLGLGSADTDDPDRPDPGFLVDYSTVRRGCTAGIAVENGSTASVVLRRFRLPLLGSGSARPFSAADVTGLGRNVTVGTDETTGRSRIVLAPGASRTLELRMPRREQLCQGAGVLSARMIEVQVSVGDVRRTIESRDSLKVAVPEIDTCNETPLSAGQ